ncbi:hypothetical protein EP30_05405 [Bifidobacterium sp. UTCIF-39]|uniref:hypothetical protein n=1 Tax=Bifidobacterium sp. UTCIF-39 TaxID=1465359 RepID=UPI00112E31D3|nr:hypothetical protein [Bifidobacterium sp. UTCIF-39]TPF96853.1 hypothetical protein EP30_05405 [Bifidobacterium sp. UTCIF-39]
MINITQRNQAYDHVISQIQAMIDTAGEHIHDTREYSGYISMGYEIINTLYDEMLPPASMRARQ